MKVEVAYGWAPGKVDLCSVDLPDGSNVGDALRLSGILNRYALIEAAITAGIWGKAKPLTTLLRERDRVEVYRPLKVDPKEARRQRYGQHKKMLQERKERLARQQGG